MAYNCTNYCCRHSSQWRLSTGEDWAGFSLGKCLPSISKIRPVFSVLWKLIRASLTCLLSTQIIYDLASLRNVLHSLWGGAITLLKVKLKATVNLSIISPQVQIIAPTLQARANVMMWMLLRVWLLLIIWIISSKINVRQIRLDYKIVLTKFKQLFLRVARPILRERRKLLIVQLYQHLNSMEHVVVWLHSLQGVEGLWSKPTTRLGIQF